jgi:hypothetical protein
MAAAWDDAEPVITGGSVGPGDHGADAGVGEQLEEDHVGDAAIEDVG